MDEAELKERAGKIKWWHKIQLTPEFTTDGKQDVSTIIPYSAVPADLTGKRVIDIGAWDGGLSFELEKRGAAEVVALDTWDGGCGRDWEGKMLPVDTTQSQPFREGFDLAHEVLNSKVKMQQMSVMDVSPQNVGMFDIVFMWGLIYHLIHPVRALEKVRAICQDLLILETHLDLTSITKPATAFYGFGECAGDRTTWWGPNEACVVSWLRAAGFRTAECVGRLGEGFGSRASFHARVINEALG